MLHKDLSKTTKGGRQAAYANTARGIAVAVFVQICAPAFALAQDSAPLIKPGAPGEPATILSPEESVALGKSHYSDADVAFMQNMIIHHQQAVDMVALIAGRSTHQGIQQMGDRIARSQAAEIAMMKNWLKARQQSLTPPAFSAHAHHMMNHHKMPDAGPEKHHMGHDMPPNKPTETPAASTMDPDDIPAMGGMLSVNDMKKLAGLQGTDFDRMFLAGMIVHHQGALDMVAMLNAQEGAAEDVAIAEFLSAIIADQTTEIQRMRAMLNESYAAAPSAP